MSSDFSRLPADQGDSGILAGLARIGQFLDADRTFLFKFNWDRTQFSISHLWESERTKIDQTVRGSIVRELFPWLHEKLTNGEDVIVQDSEKLLSPETMAEYQYCQQIGIKSFFVLPVQVADTPLCAIGLDSIRTKKEWPKEIRDHLRLIGEIFANVIERQHSETQIKEAEQKYRTIADYTFDWEYWLNPDGSLQWMSKSCKQISGYTDESFMKNPSLLKDIIIAEDKNDWEKHHCDAKTGKKSKDIKFRINRADGEIRWIEHSCQPVFDEKGNNKGIRASNRDITTREFFRAEAHQLQTELTHMERIVTVGALTSALAHEINQPLAAIQSYAQAALRFMSAEQPEYENVQKALQGIVSDNKRAAAVVNGLRDLVKKGSTRSEQFSLNSNINEVISLINSEVVLRKASLMLDLSPDDPTVQSDPVQIQQVILNLLSNALDAIEGLSLKRRFITIRTKSENSDKVIVTVSDQGVGIPPDKLDLVFTPFQTTKSKGMGLGLAICKSIVDAQGGKIWVENNPDGGTTFSFTLPLIEK